MIMERMNETDKTEYDTGAQDKAVGAQGQIARSQGGKARRIGIMGGTFNPIHNGHLIIAEDIREKTGLDKVLFIPSGQPPHKPGYEVADAEHRFEMVSVPSVPTGILRRHASKSTGTVRHIR